MPGHTANARTDDRTRDSATQSGACHCANCCPSKNVELVNSWRLLYISVNCDELGGYNKNLKPEKNLKTCIYNENRRDQNIE